MNRIRPRRWTAVAAAAVLVALGACRGEATEPSMPPPPATTGAPEAPPVASTAPAAPRTSAAPAAAAGTWPAGTVTCAGLEGNVPVGVDDYVADLDAGFLTFYWGAAESATVQFLDDATCGRDTDAWRFLIGHNLDPELLHRSGRLCDYHAWLTGAEPAPANVQSVLAALAAGEDLCR